MTAFVTLSPRDLRNKVIFIFQIGKFNPSNLGRDLMLEKSCDAMKTSILNMQQKYSQTKVHSTVVGPKARELCSNTN